jgi:hypothetical protein
LPCYWMAGGADECMFWLGLSSEELAKEKQGPSCRAQVFMRM